MQVQSAPQQILGLNFSNSTLFFVVLMTAGEVREYHYVHLLHVAHYLAREMIETLIDHINEINTQ